jgi:membrane-associated phospholipid phosphatase
METWLTGQIPLIVWLQALGPWLSLPMKAVTWLGATQFLLIVLLAIYWCIDSVLGLRLGLILLTSTGLNGVLKLALGLPRPYWVSSRVQPLSTEPSFGFPSGHAQDGLVFWGRLAAWFGHAWLWIGALAIVLVVSLSRIVLGVHFPMDVLGGWLIGALVLGAFMWLEPPATRWLTRQSDRLKLQIAVLASLVLLFLYLLVWALTAGRPVPGDWIVAASMALSAPKVVDPRALETAFQVSGLLLGLAAGGVLLNRRGGFSPAGPWSQRGLRFITGLAGLVIIYFGPRLILPQGESGAALIVTYLHHALTGLWVSWLGPLVFIVLKLAPAGDGLAPPAAARQAEEPESES